MARGGKRPGAGRPKGSKNLRRFQDYLTEEEVIALVQEGKERAAKSDRIYIEFIQQIFGKAAQALDLTSNGEAFGVIMLPPKKHGENTLEATE